MLELPALTSWSIVLAWLLGVILLGQAVRTAWPTTLRAPLLWSVVVWGLLGALLLAKARRTSYADYLCGVAPVLPILSLLGAKRPQNGAWQFIVFTLLGVLLLPALRGWALGESSPQVHTLYSWLIAAHLLLGVGNYVLTRHWVATCFYAVGAVTLAGSYLPIALPTAGERKSFAVVYFFAAMVAALVVERRSMHAACGLQRLWRDFRNTYGAVWTLRLAERINSTAKLRGWPVELTWRGIRVEGASPSPTCDDADLATLAPDVRHRIERELRSYLRRFVSHEWIVRRMPSHGAESMTKAADASASVDLP